MKINKKILSFIVCLVMVLNLCLPTLTAFAAETGKPEIKLTASASNLKRGDTVDVTMSLNTNKAGVAGVNILVKYDTDVFELIKDVESVLPSEYANGKLSQDVNRKDIGVCGFMLVKISGEPLEEYKGNVCKAYFKVKDNAKLGETKFTFYNNPNDIMWDYPCIGSDYKEISTSLVETSVNINLPLEAISIKNSTTISAGATEKLVPTFKPTDANNKKITWKSSDTSIAEVNAEGIVKGIKPGKATITATSVDGNHTATCNVEVVCSHTKTTVHKAVASTCMVQGHAEYTTCDGCGKIIKGSDAKLELADHTYGELIPEVGYVHTADELLDGVKAHYECSVCKKIFNESKKEVTKEDLVIKAPAHKYGEWEVNTDSHWKSCGCGNIIDKEAHKGGKATCTQKAHCEICNVTYGNIDPKNHVNTEIRGYVEETCTKDGYTGDTYCKDCNEKIADGTKIPAAHKGGEATCTKKAICEVCKKEYGEINPENHVNTEIKNAVEATKEKEGYTGDVYCKDCDTVVEEGKVIPVVVEETKENNKTEKNEKTDKKEDSTKPRTFDDSHMVIWISLLAISGISFVVIAKSNIRKKLGRHSK